MKKLNDIFETLIQHFKKEDSPAESAEETDTSAEPRLSRSGRSAKRTSSKGHVFGVDTI